MKLNEDKAIKAKQIVDNPDEVYYLTQAIIMVMDTSITQTFASMIQALNILYDADWEIISTTVSSTNMYAFLKNTQYKRKNS